MEKVSVIIPMYNSSKYILECLNSVLKQTYKNLEIIIIDDKSTDNSVDIVKKINDERIVLIEQDKNVGAASTRNEGIKKATGDFICFLDSDDYWKFDKIEKQIDYIKKNDYVFIYSNYNFIKDGKTHATKVPESLTYNEAIKNTTIFTSTVMFNMKYLKKEDIFMPNYKIGEDTATWWKVLKKGIIAYGMNEALAFYRLRDDSLSANKIKAVFYAWKLYKNEKMNFLKKIYSFNCYLLNAIKRRIIL